MNVEIVDAYEKIFNDFRIVNQDEFIAKESIQMTMLKILIAPAGRITIRDPRRFIIASSRNFAKDVKRVSQGVKKNTYYDSETPAIFNEESGESLSLYEVSLNEVDHGQLSSTLDKIHLDDVKKCLGNEYDFVLDHLDFSDGTRVRGAKGVSNNPRIFDSDKDRYRMAYLRKRLKKIFK